MMDRYAHQLYKGENMAKSSRYVLIAIVLIAVLGVGGFFGYRFLSENRKEDQQQQMTSTGDIPQTIENPDVENKSFATQPETEESETENPTIDNSDLEESLRTPENMQKVIDSNRQDLNNGQVVDQLAPSYPSDLVPVYKAKSAADSADIITVNGKPGWTATYGSDSSVEEINQFYSELLGEQDGYTNEKTGSANNIKAIVDNCTIEINVAPNNKEQTGLDDTSNVNIFIERN